MTSLARGPVPGVVWIDDLHLVDASTRQAVAFVARRLAGRPILLLVAWRPEISRRTAWRRRTSSDGSLASSRSARASRPSGDRGARSGGASVGGRSGRGGHGRGHHRQFRGAAVARRSRRWRTTSRSRPASRAASRCSSTSGSRRSADRRPGALGGGRHRWIVRPRLAPRGQRPVEKMVQHGHVLRATRSAYTGNFFKTAPPARAYARPPRRGKIPNRRMVSSI